MPSAFAAAELEQALSEVPWGIRTHRILQDHAAPPNEARAEVDLLEEGRTVTVACSEGGWTIVASTGRCCKPGRAYDTLDDILLAVSPAFEAMRMSKLMEKLAGVAEDRNGLANEAEDHIDEAAITP
ncbi:hypothetical protein JCM3770_001611 [Rhodotorula araucariae]